MAPSLTARDRPRRIDKQSNRYREGMTWMLATIHDAIATRYPDQRLERVCGEDDGIEWAETRFLDVGVVVRSETGVFDGAPPVGPMEDADISDAESDRQAGERRVLVIAANGIAAEVYRNQSVNLDSYTHWVPEKRIFPEIDRLLAQPGRP